MREPADAAARATELLDPLRAYLEAHGRRPLVIRDLGCGTGSLGRWLAGRLPGPQHWVLCDRDLELLAHAEVAGPQGSHASADGTPVSVTVREHDVTELTPADLADTSLVAASALLDLLTAAEVDRLAAACAASGCAALLALSVTGRVELTPAEPLDAEISAAFNAHQRRVVTGNGRLLGPAAADVARDAFERRGARVRTAPSPWRLGAGCGGDHGEHADHADHRDHADHKDHADHGNHTSLGAFGELTDEWLTGWVGAAIEQRPELSGPASEYLRRRLAARAAGELCVVVHHVDLLALPAERSTRPGTTPPGTGGAW